jgi:hypothetical protein
MWCFPEITASEQLSFRILGRNCLLPMLLSRPVVQLLIGKAGIWLCCECGREFVGLQMAAYGNFIATDSLEDRSDMCTYMAIIDCVFCYSHAWLL